jgi:ubiquinone/menaquinone biosynthesis C-methylase UbiE
MLICRFEEARDGFIAEFARRYLTGKKILELGCGNGDRTKLFYEVCDVVGIDIVDKLSKERKRNFDFLLADATKLPFRDNSFDAVVSFDVIEHILDDQKFVAEAFRVCKKKGYLVLGTPNRLRLSNRVRSLLGKKITYPYCLGPNTVHVREYTQEELLRLLKTIGFVGECMAVYIGLVGKINRGLRVFPRSIAPLAQYLLFIGYKP